MVRFGGLRRNHQNRGLQLYFEKLLIVVIRLINLYQTLNATQDHPACPQYCLLPPLLCPQSTSEDCLYLDIVTPRLSANSSAKWPVMVFFAGGAFEMGMRIRKSRNSSLITFHRNSIFSGIRSAVPLQQLGSRRGADQLSTRCTRLPGHGISHRKFWVTIYSCFY